MRRPSFLSRCCATEKHLSAKLNFTQLEDRVTPTLNASFLGGQLNIQEISPGADNLVVTASNGFVSVKNNGVDVTITGGPALANTVKQMIIVTGADNDTIDLSGVTAASFPALFSSVPDGFIFLNPPPDARAKVEVDSGDGNDIVFDIDGGSKIKGGKGNDKIDGKGGDDEIDGGEGDDEIDGGFGKDDILGGFGKDVLRGGGGNDRLRGGPDEDDLFGGPGDDSLEGDLGDDVLDGGGHLGDRVLIEKLVVDGQEVEVNFNRATGAVAVVSGVQAVEVPHPLSVRVVNTVIDDTPAAFNTGSQAGDAVEMNVDDIGENLDFLDDFEALITDLEFGDIEPGTVLDFVLKNNSGFEVGENLAIFFELFPGLGIQGGSGSENLTVEDGQLPAPLNFNGGPGEDSMTVLESDEAPVPALRPPPPPGAPVNTTNVEVIKRNKRNADVADAISDVTVDAPVEVCEGSSFLVTVSFTALQDLENFKVSTLLDDALGVQSNVEFETLPNLASAVLDSASEGVIADSYFNAKKGQRVTFTFKRIASFLGQFNADVEISSFNGFPLSFSRTVNVIDCGGANDGDEANNIATVDETTNTASSTGNGGTLTSTEQLLAILGQYFAFIANGTDFDDNVTQQQHGSANRSANVGDPIRLDVSFDGRNGANGNVSAIDGSRDGRFVAFSSRASNLVHGIIDTSNLVDDIFVRNLLTGTTELISVNTAGTHATGTFQSGNNTENINPRISSDGRFVVWEGADVFGLTGVTDSTTSFETDIFWHDRLTGETRLISKNAAGTASGNGDSSNPQVSDDGRYIAFLSTATNLLSGFLTSSDQLFLHDTTTGVTKLITINVGGTAPAAPDFTTPKFNLARDTGHVVFSYSATDLVAGFVNNNNTSEDIFVYDPVTGKNELVSGLTATTTSNGGYSSSFPGPKISDDGRIVAFNITGNNLPGATETVSSNQHLYVRDRLTGALELIDIRPDNKQAFVGTSGNPFDLSPDGRYVGFFSSDTAMLAGFPDGNNGSTPDLFVRDRAAAFTTVVNVNAAGTTTSNNGIGSQNIIRFSGDGRELAFVYSGTDLVTIPDTNQDNDIFTTSRHVRFDLAAPAGTNVTFRRNGANYELINTGTLAVIASRNATASETVRIAGLDGILTIDFASGPIVIAEGLTVAGKAGGTSKIVVNGGDFAQAEHLLLTANSGISTYDGFNVSYSDVIDYDDNAIAATRIVGDASEQNRTVSVTGSGGIVSLAGAGFVPLSFPDPAEALTFLMSDGNDSVTVGNLGANYNTATLSVFGEGGNDTLNAGAVTHKVALRGGSGNDILTGGSGADNLFDGSGNDVLTGGLGNDTYTLTPGSDDVVSDSGGTDTLDFSFASEGIFVDLDATAKQTVTASGDTLQLTGTIENITGSNFNDVISLAALSVLRTVNGGPEVFGITVGDRLIVNTNGLASTDNGTKISTPGKADITYSEIETLNLSKVFAVLNANDTGVGSLRQAILDANANTGFDTIVFESVFFSTPRTITFGNFALISDAVDILGPGKASVTLSGNNAKQVFIIDGGSVTLSGLTFANANTGSNGSAVAITDEAVTIRDSAFTNNKSTAGFGGAISNQAGSSLNITNTTFTGNQAANGGGAILSNGELIIANSTFSGNSTAGDGGAVFATSAASIVNSTLNNNTAGDDGGALFLSQFATLSQVTVSGNSAADGAIALASTFADELTIRNSTIVNNTGGGLFAPGLAGETTIESTILGNANTLAMRTSITRSLVNSPIAGATLDGFTAENLGVNPLLGSLASNGGPVQTHLPLANSPALDAGDNPDALTTDARGFSRTDGVRLDIGAAEGVSGNLPAVIGFSFGNQFLLETAQRFTLTFADDGDIDPTTFDGNDIRVTGPNGFDVPAKLIDDGNFGPPLIPTYEFAPPGGVWDASDLGTYVVRIQPNQIFDKTGKAVLAGAAADLEAVFGQIFTVTNANDSGAGSLRQATLNANRSVGADQIRFDPAFFSVPRTIQLTSGQLQLTDATAITGPGKSLLTVDGQGASRVLAIDFNFPQDAVVSGMTIKNGFLTNDDGAGIASTSAHLTLTDMTLSNNTVSGSGGETGSSALLISGGSAAIQSSTFSNNTFAGTGTTSLRAGAVNFINSAGGTITDSVIISNSATMSGTANALGGGLALFTNTPVTVTRTTISGNSVDGGGGGIYHRNSPLSVIDSTISGNSVAVSGGGIVLGFASTTTTVTLRNTTVSGNSASLNGGGVRSYTSFTGTANIQNSTITANSANTGAGGGINRGAGFINLASTIVAGNTNTSAPDLSGIISSTRSLIGKADGSTLTDGGGNILGTIAAPVNALLGLLADNGGTTLTHAPQATSPVRNAGSNPAVLAFDARGQARTQQGFTDIGAVETSDATPTAFVTVTPITSKGATSQSLTVTYADETAINGSTIGAGDITINGPGGFTVNPDFVSVDAPGNGSPRTATFTFTPPGGSWDHTDNGIYRVLMNAGQVLDTDISPNAVPSQIIGGFFPNVPQFFTVDTLADTVASDGKTSLREAITAANGSVNTAIIDFDPLLNGGTITLAGTQLPTVTRAVTIAGPGAGLLSVSGNLVSRILSLDVTQPGDVITISGLTLSKGSVSGNGGAIDNVDAALVIRNSVVSFSTASTSGGAINLGSSAIATLLVEDSTLIGNTASTGDGGAVRGTNTGSFVVRRSTIASNKADDEGSAIAFTSGGLPLIENSTISGNTTGAGGLGGALYITGGSANITIRNSTLSGNSSNTGSAIRPVFSAKVTLQNSTVTANQGFNAIGSGTGTVVNIDSSVVSGNSGTDLAVAQIVTANSFLGNVGTSPVTGTFLTGNAKLGALADNGGPTLTHLPASDSPLLNAGANLLGLATDQRGLTRSVGVTDIGAVEVQPNATVSSIVVNNGNVQRSRLTTIQVNFATPVDAALFQSVGAITLTRTAIPTGGSAVIGTVVNSSNGLLIAPASGMVSSLTLTFANVSNAGVNHRSLADGRWQLAVTPAGFTSNAGDSQLRRLFGDSDNSGLVDGTDFGGFGSGFGSSPGPGVSPFDFNDDGANLADDFAEFGNRFGLTL